MTYFNPRSPDFSVKGFLAMLAAGVAVIVATTLTVTNLNVSSQIDITEVAAPGAGAAGTQRIYGDSTAHKLKVYENAGATAKTIVRADPPTKADATSDNIIGASATTQTPLSLQALNSQSVNTFEIQDHTGAANLYGFCEDADYYWGVYGAARMGYGTTVAGLRIGGGACNIGFTATDETAADSVRVGYASAGQLTVRDGSTSNALHVGANGGIHGNAVAVTPSATTTDHTTDGATCTVHSHSHSVAAGQVVTLAGWTWNAGGGVVNGSWYVTSVTDTNNFVITPTTCPTAASNPTVVGTVTVSAQVQVAGVLTTVAPLADVAIGATATTQIPVVVQAKAGQTADFLQFQNSTGAYLTYVNKLGSIGAPNIYETAGGTDGWLLGNYFTTPGLLLGTGCAVRFTEDATYYGTIDTALARSAAAELKATNGGTSNALHLTAAGGVHANAVAASTGSTIACATNVVTVVTTAAHNLATGQIVNVNAVDNTYDDNNAIVTVTNSTTFTYPLTHANEGAKADAGTITPLPVLQVASAATTPEPLADTLIGASATTQKPLVIQGKAGQTAYLLDLQGSDGSNLAYIGSTGAVVSTANIISYAYYQCKSASGAIYFGNPDDVSLQRYGATTLALNDGADVKQMLLGTGTAAFHVDNTAGPDITLRARDAESTDTATRDGGSLILFPGQGTGTTPGQNGTVQNGRLALTTATATTKFNGTLNTGWYKCAVTTAMAQAGGEATTTDVKLCTLPALTAVRRVLVRIDTQGAHADTLTVSVGRTGASYIDYVVASDGKGVANTFYGNAMAEIGSNLKDASHGDSPIEDFAGLVAAGATTDVYSQVKCGSGHIHDLSGLTFTVWIEYYELP